MGSPVSVVVAEIVMQNIEEQVLATYLLRPLSSIVAKGEELRNRRNEVKERIRKKTKQNKTVAALLVFVTSTLFC